ncbi:MAG: glutamine synthetase III [Desulfarculales bacterium]|jgi:glutamine synthetase|nr:glutamine synthetase III [Desulfarculales bacterium]
MSFSPRNRARFAVADDQFVDQPADYKNYSQIYGQDVFNMRVMRERLPQNVYERLEQVARLGQSLAEGDADVIASAMKDWAIEKGATHYTHWFQPMTSLTAEKHDAFAVPTSGGYMINEFSGKMLIKGEPDASSFPSGGLRTTFEARGYTAWDPTSPAFVMGNRWGKTLYIPTLFMSYTGESLDRKTPLLRSLNALSKQALRILRLFGNTTATKVQGMVGAEQEYFLVDRRYAKLRMDLLLAGRTVYGAMPSKGQELEDQYFGAISPRIIDFMGDVEARMVALGIPARTRHNEVAPSQFELAPLYEEANLATDHNMLTMVLLRATAERHGLMCLLHEKPFAGINGSGKHNNWSLCDSDGNNLLEPGSTPLDNAQFLVFLAAVLRAVHLHAPVLRLGTVGAGNDHRLGANEAPPAIISVFLGAQLTNLIEGIAAGKADGSGWKRGTMEIGVSTIPPLPKDISDRNRTSPFAFTGNKFEFRAVGSSQSISPANFALNAAVACALDDIATELEAGAAKGVPLNQAVQTLLARLFKEHLPVVFNGNGYAEQWQEEAARRGLPNLKDSVAALARYSDKDVMDVFLRHGILDAREQLARQEILLEAYLKNVLVETKLTSQMGRSVILPAVLKYLRQSAELAARTQELTGETASFEEQYYKKLRVQASGLLSSLDELDKRHQELNELDREIMEKAEMARDVLLPLMAQCRRHADALEEMIDDDIWPLPKYDELLWHR